MRVECPASRPGRTPPDRPLSEAAEPADPAEAAELAALRDEHALLREAFERLPQGVSFFDGQDRLLLANGRYREIWALPEHVLRPGTPFSEIMACTPGEETERSRAQPLPMPRSEGTRQREWLLRDGRVVQVVVSRRTDGSCIALHEDVTAQRQTQARIGFLASHDTLTGLPNRSAFVELLQQALARRAEDGTLAVLGIDLDRFKPVNDALGHAAGDELLRHVGERLRRCVREGDRVARLGGDEFALLQTGGAQPPAAVALARRVIDALSRPFELGGQRVHIGCSVGIAVAPQDGSEAAELLHRADLAMYQAKSAGRGVHRLYEPGLEDAQRERQALEADLRQALASNAFTLAYQPQVDLVQRRVTGAEALLRWNHPLRGAVSPAEFVPLAEETGLIVPLGRWVLERACADAAAWPEPVRVAVNVSLAQFRHGRLAAEVDAALAASGLAPSRLEIEITESVVLDDPEQVRATLHALRARGVRVALDDFGTGFSSLSNLLEFRFDRLKVDRRFVRDVERHEDKRAVIAAVALLGRRLGMATTVEGVETARQLEIVAAEGGVEVQGFFFSRPQPAESLPALFRMLAERPLPQLTR